MQRDLKNILIIVLLLILSSSAEAQLRGFGKIRWKHERVARGLKWIHSHTILEDSIPQNLNILVVNPQVRKIFLVYNREKNVPVSEMEKGQDDLAAINAGFFDIQKGGSVTYIKTGGKVTDTDTASMWPRVENMSGLLVIRHDGKFIIDRERSNGWIDSCSYCRDALITGPLLLLRGRKVVLPGTSLTVNRNPRTAAGIRRNGDIILITLDGRTGEAAGVTLPMLTDLMLSLGCTDAVNLDGGGSTTMWIKNRPFRGVVNMPSDNKKFDHEGERPVADILVVR